MTPEFPIDKATLPAPGCGMIQVSTRMVLNYTVRRHIDDSRGGDRTR